MIKWTGINDGKPKHNETVLIRAVIGSDTYYEIGALYDKGFVIFWDDPVTFSVEDVTHWTYINEPE